jgi:hypothetical protein
MLYLVFRRAFLSKELSNKKVSIEKISFTAYIVDESDEPFGFDQEILIFSPPYKLMPPSLSNKDYTKFISLHDGYAPERRRLGLTSRTNDVALSNLPLQSHGQLISLTAAQRRVVYGVLSRLQ